MRLLPHERFQKYFQEADGCWMWQGKKWHNGYGAFYVGGGRSGPKVIGAHRFAWEMVNGPIPDGLEIDHLCKTRACVNPAHMEVVTHAENMRRATGWKKVPATHCKYGHPFDEENTTFLPDGKRACRTCQRERMRKHRGERQQMSPRPCAMCGTVFTPDRHPGAKYCSGACNTAAFRRRKREESHEPT